MFHVMTVDMLSKHARCCQNYALLLNVRNSMVGMGNSTSIYFHE